MVEDGDGIKSVRDAIEGGEGNLSEQNDGTFDAAGLLEDKWTEKWTIEYFAMPQAPGPQKLFKFPTERKGSSGYLTEFLCQAELNKGNRKLYMEAHIWPRSKRGKRV